MSADAQYQPILLDVAITIVTSAMVGATVAFVIEQTRIKKKISQKNSSNTEEFFCLLKKL